MIRIKVANQQELVPVDYAKLREIGQAVLSGEGVADAKVTLAFVDNPTIHRLNKQFLDHDEPTDVLSFAYHESEGEHEFAAAANHLGDLVVSVETAERYAGELGLSFARELEHLVIHGTLHLAGYDHETDHGEMNRLEKRLRKQLLD